MDGNRSSDKKIIAAGSLLTGRVVFVPSPTPGAVAALPIAPPRRFGHRRPFALAAQYLLPRLDDGVQLLRVFYRASQRQVVAVEQLDPESPVGRSAPLAAPLSTRPQHF